MGKGPGASYTRRPSTFQNGSQGDFPTGVRAEPLKRNRIRLQPQLGPLEGETQVNNRRVRSRRTPRWQRGLCNPGLAPVPGHLAPSARALLAGPGSVPRDLAGGRAKWECLAGKSFCSSIRPRYARGHKCGPLCPPSAARWSPASSPPGCTLLGARSPLPAPLTLAAAMLWPWCRRRFGTRSPAGCTGDPGDSLPVPAEVGAAIRPGGVGSRPASPRPPGAGHAGAVSPLAGPGQGLPVPRDLKASALKPGRALIWELLRDQDT